MSMLRSSIVLSAISFLCSLVSFGNQIIIAHLFGASQMMDAYLMASSIPILVSGTITAVLSYSMVPILISNRSSSDSYGQFTGLMFLVFAGIALLIFSVGHMASPLIISLLAVSPSSQLLAGTVMMARVSWGTSGIAVIMAFLCAMQNAGNRFYMPALAGLFPYLGMIFFGVFFGKAIGPIAIAWGMLAGTLAGVGMLLKRAYGELQFSRAILGRWREAVQYGLSTPFILVATCCFTVYQSIDSFWAPRIGTGNLACLGYSQRLIVAIGSLVIAGPSVVLVPRLAESHLNGRHKDFYDDLTRALRMVLAIVVPIAVLGSFLAFPLVQLLFQRGAFDEAAAERVASLLPFMMVGLAAMLCVIIIFRALYASGQFKEAAVLGTLCMVLYFVLSGVLSPHFHAEGIAFAYAFSWWTTMFGAFAIMRRKFAGSFSLRVTILYFSKLLGSVLTMCMVVGISSSLWILPMDKIGFWMLGVRVGLIFAAGLLVYCIAALKVFVVPEMVYLSNDLGKKLQRTQI